MSYIIGSGTPMTTELLTNRDRRTLRRIVVRKYKATTIVTAELSTQSVFSWKICNYKPFITKVVQLYNGSGTLIVIYSEPKKKLRGLISSIKRYHIQLIFLLSSLVELLRISWKFNNEFQYPTPRLWQWFKVLK